MAGTGKPLCNSAGAMLYGPTGAPLYDGVPAFPSSLSPNAAMYLSAGGLSYVFYASPRSAPPPFSKADVLPGMLALYPTFPWQAFSPSSLAYAASVSLWAVQAGIASCNVLAEAARFDTSAYAGRHLTSIKCSVVQVWNPQSPAFTFYVSVAAMASATPPNGIAWIPAGTIATGPGILTVNCNCTLSNYLFVVLWWPSFEFPDAQNAQNALTVNLSSIGIIP